MCPIKHVIIAAAGVGSRMGSDFPKCQINFFNKPLLHHLLENFNEIEDVRIVVGYKCSQVIDLARKIRNDITFIFNNSYKTTTTLHSYYTGGLYLNEGAIYVDADIYFMPNSIKNFIMKAGENTSSALIGVTATKTEDCVYAKLHQQSIISFSRAQYEPYEWANIAYLPPNFLKNTEQVSVYKELEKSLPLASFIVDSFEVDTPTDLKNAENSIYNFNNTL